MSVAIHTWCCLQGDYGDVSERQRLRESLHCKSFDWFMKNISHMKDPYVEVVHAGEVWLPNFSRGRCFRCSFYVNSFKDISTRVLSFRLFCFGVFWKVWEGFG